MYDAATIAAVLEGPDGETARMLSRLAVEIESVAKVNATGIPVAGASNPQGRGPRVRSGRGRSSITWVLGRDGAGLFADVGTNVYYMGYLEKGLVFSRTGPRRYPFLKPALDTVVGITPAAYPMSSV